MNPSILSAAMTKELSKLFPLTLVWQPIKEKKNTEFKPVKPRLKH